MVISLVPQTSVTNTNQLNPSSGNNTVGNLFTVSEAVTVAVLSFYRDVVGHDGPSKLALYDGTSSTMLADATVPGDDGSAGWHEVAITPVGLVTGHNYIVFGRYPDGTWITAWSTSPPAPEAPFSVTGVRYAASSASTPYPGSVSSWELAGVSVLTGVYVPPPAGEAGDPTTTGDLQAWFSTNPDANLHQDDGLPWRTDAIVTIVRGEAEGESGFAAIKAVADTIATSVGSGLGTAVSALGTALATANTALVHAASTWSDALATALQDMSDDFASFGASKPAQGGGDFGAGTFPSDVGTLVWTMLDETDFAGEIAWAQPADVYALSITTRPSGLPLNLTDGVHTIYRCGWWCPLNGSFARQRSYIDFEDSHLAIGAERMPGILVSLAPGGEGHIQAWALM